MGAFALALSSRTTGPSSLKYNWVVYMGSAHALRPVVKKSGRFRRWCTPFALLKERGRGREGEEGEVRVCVLCVCVCSKLIVS